jgi:hypothetical protein
LTSCFPNVFCSSPRTRACSVSEKAVTSATRSMKKWGLFSSVTFTTVTSLKPDFCRAPRTSAGVSGLENSTWICEPPLKSVP